MSVLGPLKPDPIGAALGTGYLRFRSPLGVNGLCRIAGKRLEILAVDSNHPGCGHFAEFIRQAKKEFDTICVWYVTSQILRDCLPRYKFRPWNERQLCRGEWESLEGYRWDD
jgi:hypothetical protein